jgi:phosphate uptake regulator
MVMEFFKGGVDRHLEEIVGQIAQMLVDSRHTFDLATDALFTGGNADVVGPEVRKSDKRVNKAERAVRRALVVHTSVRGGQADMPLVLAAMSIVKDAERIGDNSKNIWDLAHYGIDLSQAPDRDEMLRHRNATSRLIIDTARIFSERDSAAAEELLKSLDAVLDQYDRHVEEQLASDGPARQAVARALLYRYLKRITANAMNVLTSLVMPIDRLDFYDEDKADRL